MEIKNNPLHKAASAYSKAANIGKKTEEKKAAPAKTDTLELANDSPRNLNPAALAKDAAAEVNSPAPDNKIDAIKQQIQDGTYNPSSTDIAKAILNVE